MLDKFVEKLPEGDREAYKQAIAHAVVIQNREDAAKLISENPYLKSERDAIISRTTDNYAAKFKEEKLPDIVKEELRKLNPAKTPEQIENEELRATVKKIQRDALLKDRKAQAMQKLTEAGLPVDLADFALDEDENIFASKIEKLSGLAAWKEAEIKKALTGAVGNQKPPQGGNKPSAGFAGMTTTEIMSYAAQGPSQAAEVMEWQKQKK
jgi:hypothetical protein